MLDLETFANLQRDPSGIWVSRSSETVSFPSDGNASRATVEEKSFWYLHRNRCITAAIQNFPPAGEILDVGGGNGTVSLHLQEQGFPVVLLEPELIAATQAHKNGVNKVICSTFDAIGIQGCSIQAIGLFDVLEHIKDDISFLTKLHSCLVPGGMLYITVPSLQFLWSLADEQAGHFRRYDLDGLREILRKAGFSVPYTTYFFSTLVLPIYVLRSLPHMIGFANSGMNSRHRHHKSTDSHSGAVLDRMLAMEVQRVAKKQTLPIGSSCLAVARKDG